MLLNITSRYMTTSDHMPNIKIQVRVYFDAKVAEVLSVQGHRNIRPHYKYPNTNMYVPDEKKQGNSLLADMLRYCVKNNFKKFYYSQPIIVDES